MPAPQRGTRTFSKSALTIDELRGQLASRGLAIPNADRASRYLRHIGYYRLSPYGIPFRERLVSADGEMLGERFVPGTTFDDLLALYTFDRKLRAIVFDAIERVEVAVRASMTDWMSTRTDDPFWYMDPTHFASPGAHQELLRRVRETCDAELKRGKGESYTHLNHMSALRHFLTTYAEPELPPSWVTMEVLTLGSIHMVLKNLKNKSDKTQIAQTLGLNQPLLESWLATFVRVRNICGHHGRLWNAWLGAYPKQPTSRRVPWVDTESRAFPDNWEKKLYPALIALQVVLYTISPRSSWARRLEAHLNTGGVAMQAMGMPADWATDSFWRKALD